MIYILLTKHALDADLDFQKKKTQIILGRRGVGANSARSQQLSAQLKISKRPIKVPGRLFVSVRIFFS